MTKTAPTPIATITYATDKLSLLQMVLDALEVTGRIPAKAPAHAYPLYFTRENLEAIRLVQYSSGWIGNVDFDVPAGLGDVIGTPEAYPILTRNQAFASAARIVCEIVCGSPELPFFLVGDHVIVTDLG